jgi:hypothetical protein
MKPGASKHVRCAIYTRVSTDQGLEQDFNSLDPQYDACQAYIRSQAHAGLTLLRAKYVRTGKIDVIVVYKVDRLNGTVTSIEEIAQRERCSTRKVNMILSLAFLAADLVKAGMEGRLPCDVGIARLCDLPAS